MARKLLSLINKAKDDLPDNKRFLNDVMTGIERYSVAHRRKSSNFYKPSGLNCMRSMYFVRTEAEQDSRPAEYNAVSMADTGTKRHEAIQDVLLELKDMGYDWEYVDVADYVAMKQKEGKCLSLTVLDRCGAETHLIDNDLHISFRCDGIIKKLSTGEYFLFEFKNVVSFKYQMIEKEVLEQHHKQVICYCMELDLNKAFVLYENRDMCTLECPEVFKITDDMKQDIISLFLNCEQYVEKMQAPPKCTNPKNCRFCSYKDKCREVGD